MEQHLHPVAIHHLPFFITPPGGSDLLFTGVIYFLIAVIVAIGVFYLHLHSLPERMAHHHSKVQMEIVAVLCLIALFTHQHIFWIIALLLAMIQIPDWSSPFVSIAQSLEKLSGRQRQMKTVDASQRTVPYAPPAQLPNQPAPTRTKATD